jgi:AraC-like DNA-binding protein
MKFNESRLALPARERFVREPFGRYPLLDTRSPEEAYEALRRLSDVRSFHVPKGPVDFAVRANYFRFNHLDLTYSANETEAIIHLGERAQARQHIGLAGAAVATIGNISVDNAGPYSSVIPPGAAVRIHYGARFQQVLLRIDIDAITAKLEALTGSHVRGKLDFGLKADVREPNQQRLLRLIVALDRELSLAQSEPNSLVLAEYEQFIITSFLLGNLLNYERLLHAKPQAIMPWQVRVAEEYIEANWNKPISIEDLSRAVNASARALFKTFKEARGYSPMTFLKRARLTRAREMLRAANPRTTITGVALLCGFGNPGHFAADYRRAFGELPSETLSRHR